MSKTILANVEGWTPVIDNIVNDLGIMSAVVFGRMWRFCQMEDGVCKASLETISEGIGLDRATVMRHAKALCEGGYLNDLTPGLKNRPHVYADTGKAGLKLSLTTVAESNVTLQKVIPTVAESHLNKDSKRVIKKEKDSLGGYLDLLRKGLPEEEQIETTLNEFESGLRRNIQRTPQWQSFAKWAIKQGNHKAWIEWYMSEQFRASNSWRLTPEQIRNSWPQAKPVFDKSDNSQRLPEILS
jgi:hypothetical protein